MTNKRKSTAAQVKAWAQKQMLKNPRREVESETLKASIDAMLSMSCLNAINGDTSFGENALNELFWRVAGNTLQETDRYFLMVFLQRAAADPDALSAICGNKGRRGAPAKGIKGLRIAYLVLGRIQVGLTAEDAWEAIAVDESLSASAVKQYWIKWRPSVRALYKASAHGASPDESEDEIEQQLNDFFTRGYVKRELVRADK